MPGKKSTGEETLDAPDPGESWAENSILLGSFVGFWGEMDGFLLPVPKSGLAIRFLVGLGSEATTIFLCLLSFFGSEKG